MSLGTHRDRAAGNANERVDVLNDNAEDAEDIGDARVVGRAGLLTALGGARAAGLSEGRSGGRKGDGEGSELREHLC